MEATTAMDECDTVQIDDFADTKSQFSSMPIDFKALLEQYQNKASVLKKLRAEIESLNLKKEVNNGTMSHNVKKKAKKNIPPKIKNLVEKMDDMDSLEWAVRMLMTSSEEEKRLINNYIAENNIVPIKTALHTAQNLIDRLHNIENNFNLNEMNALLKEHTFLDPYIKKIAENWKNTSSIDLKSTDVQIMDRIYKSVKKDCNGFKLSDVLKISKVQETITDLRCLTFDLDRMITLVTKSVYSNIFELVVVGSETILRVKSENCEKWKQDSKNLKKKYLLENVVVEQLTDIFKNSVRLTELQEYLCNVLNSGDKVAACVESPTASGKSTGMLLNTTGIVVYFPINEKSYNEFVISCICTKTPFVMQIFDDNGDIRYMPSHETMGKLDNYKPNGEEYEEYHPRTLVDTYQRLCELKNRGEVEQINRLKRIAPKQSTNDKPLDEQNRQYRYRMSKILSKKEFYSTDIRYVVCSPKARKHNGLQIYSHARQYARLPAVRKLYKTLDGKEYDGVTVVIDDFAANGDQMSNEIAVSSLCRCAEKILLLTGTCPSNIGNKNTLLNKIRVENNKLPFVHKKFLKTLGLGISLHYKNLDEDMRYSFLLMDKENFDKFPTALQAISVNDTFEFLKVKHESNLRNYLIDNFESVTLDDLRNEIIEWLYSLNTETKNNIVNRVIDATKMKNDGKSKKVTTNNQTLFLDSDPIDCVKKVIGAPKDMVSYLGESIEYLKAVKKEIDDCETMQANIKKEKEHAIKNSKSGKLNDGDMTTEEKIRELDNIDVGNGSLTLPIYDKKFVVDVLNYVEERRVTQEQAKYLLQKGCLVVMEKSNQTWVESCLKKCIPFIFGKPDEFGIGVDMPNLTEVHLPNMSDKTNDKMMSSLMIQSIGRVGRSSQKMTGNVIFSSYDDLRTLIESDVGKELSDCCDDAIRRSHVNYIIKKHFKDEKEKK